MTMMMMMFSSSLIGELILASNVPKTDSSFEVSRPPGGRDVALGRSLARPLAHSHTNAGASFDPSDSAGGTQGENKTEEIFSFIYIYIHTHTVYTVNPTDSVFSFQTGTLDKSLCLKAIQYVIYYSNCVSEDGEGGRVGGCGSEDVGE